MATKNFVADFLKWIGKFFGYDPEPKKKVTRNSPVADYVTVSETASPPGEDEAMATWAGRRRRKSLLPRRVEKLKWQKRNPSNRLTSAPVSAVEEEAASKKKKEKESSNKARENKGKTNPKRKIQRSPVVTRSMTKKMLLKKSEAHKH